MTPTATLRAELLEHITECLEIDPVAASDAAIVTAEMVANTIVSVLAGIHPWIVQPEDLAPNYERYRACGEPRLTIETVTALYNEAQDRRARFDR